MGTECGLLGIESNVGPQDVEDSGSDQRIFNEERVEERRRFHDDVAQENVAAARDVTSQFPQTGRIIGLIICDTAH